MNLIQHELFNQRHTLYLFRAFEGVFGSVIYSGINPHFITVIERNIKFIIEDSQW